VIPDEYNHIRWIRQLFYAYGFKPNLKTLPLKRTSDLSEAYSLCIQLEENLIPRYERLIWSAEDDITARVIDTILRETRMHYAMFSHALRMGGMMGRGRGMCRGRGRARRGRGMGGW
jgi:rubrerythrin